MPSQEEAKAQNVARGHKAAISNPGVSEEAKEHSREVLEKEFGQTVERGRGGGAGEIVDDDDEEFVPGDGK